MDDIAKQLKNEIQSIQEYIQQTESQHLATHWVKEMLDPFDQTEHIFSQSELQEIIEALFHARNQFHVNGSLGDRIGTILDKYEDLLPAPPASKHKSTDADLGGLFVEEGDSDPLIHGAPHDALPIDFSDDTTGNSKNLFSSLDLSGDENVTLMDFDRDEEEKAEIMDFGGDDKSAETIDLGQDGEEDQIVNFGQDEEETEIVKFDQDEEETEIVKFDQAELSPADEDLFKPVSIDFDTTAADPLEPQDQPTPEKETSKRSDPLPDPDVDGLFNEAPRAREMPPGRKEKSPAPGKMRQGKDKNSDSQIDIFADKVSLEDLMLRLDISLPKRDLKQLRNFLHNKLEDRVVRTLQGHQIAAGQYVLIPRINRFVKDGTLYPCTVKNLVKNYVALFGDIKDLMRYREHAFLNSEVPTPGWALITAESQRESLDKNYMEQLQTLRYLAPSVNLPANLVRRRTLVEAIYDIIVGRMVLSKKFQEQSLDWTSSGPSKTNFVCVHYAQNGIRLTDLPRTANNRSLGFCPNW